MVVEQTNFITAHSKFRVMHIYNVTINIDDSVHDDWLVWMKETHIPDMLATGKFIAAKMRKILVDEDMGGTSYSIQYSVKNRQTLEKYYAEDAKRLRKDAVKRFPDKFVAFRTEMEIVSEH